MKSMMMMALVCVAMAASLTSAEPTFSYPKCTSDESKCCTLSPSAKMAHHGYFLAMLNGKETVVTCKETKIECHLGNPSLRATTEQYGAITCPDFTTIFESRSVNVEILEGVLDTPSTASDSDNTLGEVKAASA